MQKTREAAGLTGSSAEDELLLALRSWGAGEAVSLCGITDWGGEGGARLGGAAVSYLLRRFTGSHQWCPLLCELLGHFQSGF